MSDPVRLLFQNYSATLANLEARPVDTARLEQRVRGTLRARSAERAVSVRRLQWAVAAAFVLSASGSVLAYQWGEQRAQAAAETMPAGQWLTSQANAPTDAKFNDGSSLRLEGESRARVQFAQRTGGLVHLDSGTVRLKVRHRDGSTWRVAAGPYEVEAIGTEFVVDWSRSQPLRVSVTEGTVAVRGHGIQGTRFVSAQQSVELSEGAQPKTEPAGAAESPAIAVSSLPLDAPPAQNGEQAWRALEAAGKYDEAIRAAERRGLSSLYRTASADDLLSLARAARFSGRAALASSALTACRERFAGSQQAAMAAFLLGRGTSGRQAARWFSTYLREAPGGALAREALGRLIEAELESGNQSAAKTAASRYLKSYPDGPHVPLAREVLGR